VENAVSPSLITFVVAVDPAAWVLKFTRPNGSKT